MHVRADAYDFSDVVAEFADVGAAFAGCFEEDVSPVHLQEFVIVNAPGADLTLN